MPASQTTGQQTQVARADRQAVYVSCTFTAGSGVTLPGRPLQQPTVPVLSKSKSGAVDPFPITVASGMFMNLVQPAPGRTTGPPQRSGALRSQHPWALVPGKDQSEGFSLDSLTDAACRRGALEGPCSPACPTFEVSASGATITQQHFAAMGAPHVR